MVSQPITSTKALCVQQIKHGSDGPIKTSKDTEYHLHLDLGKENKHQNPKLCSHQHCRRSDGSGVTKMGYNRCVDAHNKLAETKKRVESTYMRVERARETNTQRAGRGGRRQIRLGFPI